MATQAPKQPWKMEKLKGLVRAHPCPSAPTTNKAKPQQKWTATSEKTRARNAKNRKKNRKNHRERKKAERKKLEQDEKDARRRAEREEVLGEESDEWDPWHQANGPDAQKEDAVDLDD